MKQWDRLPNLYTQLHEVLREDGLVTKAKLSRKVAEEGKTSGYDMVYAAGLAALTGSGVGASEMVVAGAPIVFQP